MENAIVHEKGRFSTLSANRTKKSSSFSCSVSTRDFGPKRETASGDCDRLDISTDTLFLGHNNLNT